MELLEAREAELRRRVVGAAAAPRSGGYASRSIIERMQRVNAQLEQLQGAVNGFARLSEMYHANRELLQLNRNGQQASGGDELKRAVILSSEDHIAGAVTELQKLQELQRYVVQLQQIHSSSEQARGNLERLENTHAQQEERALLVHARVENILGVYQEMVQVLSEKCVEYSAVLDQLTRP